MCLKELLMLDSNTWNYLTMCKQMIDIDIHVRYIQTKLIITQTWEILVSKEEKIKEIWWIGELQLVEDMMKKLKCNCYSYLDSECITFLSTVFHGI